MVSIKFVALPGVSQWPFPASKAMLPNPRRYSSQRRPKSTLPSSLLWMSTHPGRVKETFAKTKARKVCFACLNYIFTSVIGGLITEDLVRWIEAVGLDQVHLGVSSSTAVDFLALLTWTTPEKTPFLPAIASCQGWQRFIVLVSNDWQFSPKQGNYKQDPNPFFSCL